MRTKQKKFDKRQDRREMQDSLDNSQHKMRKAVTRGWNVIRKHLEKKERNGLVNDDEFCIFLKDKPKLVKKIKSPYYCRAMEFVDWFGKDQFFFVGIKNNVEKWTFQNHGRLIKKEEIAFPYALLNLVHLEKNKLFMGLNFEKVLTVINVIRGIPKELLQIEQLITARTFRTIPEISTLIVGGSGFMKRFTLTGILQTNTIEEGKDIHMTLGEEEWVKNLYVDEYSHSLHVVTETGINIIDYFTWRQTYRLTDPSGGTLSCCCVFDHNTFLITGCRFGYVKVWSTAIRVLMHQFVGHRDSITGVACHDKQPILVSSSSDGWIFIWRLDIFRKFKQIKVGDTVGRLHVSTQRNMDSIGFWCEVNQVLHFYEMAEPYAIFSCMDSTVIKLKRLLGHEEYPNRILIATGDGGLWFKNPVTAETVGFMFPMISLMVINRFAYDVQQQKLYVILPEGGVLTLGCDRSPFRAVERLPPKGPDETAVSIVDVYLSVGTEDVSFDCVVILLGLHNGQIELMEMPNLFMPLPVQAHHGSVLCMETLPEVAPSGERTYNTDRMLVTAGSDMLIKLWHLQIEVEEGLGFHFSLVNALGIRCDKLPRFVASFDDRIAAVFHGDTALTVFDIGGTTSPPPKLKYKSSVLKLSLDDHATITHSKDYEHTDTITALDKCPLLRLFATSSMDQSVKIWDDKNCLIRELLFEEPVVDIAFISDIGDILIARDNLLVYSPPEKYLPWCYLRNMMPKNYKEEDREAPKHMKESEKTWVDPKRVPVRRGRPSAHPNEVWEVQEWQMDWRDPFVGPIASVAIPVRFNRRRRRGSRPAGGKLDVLRESSSSEKWLFNNRERFINILPPGSLAAAAAVEDALSRSSSAMPRSLVGVLESSEIILAAAAVEYGTERRHSGTPRRLSNNLQSQVPDAESTAECNRRMSNAFQRMKRVSIGSPEGFQSSAAALTEKRSKKRRSKPRRLVDLVPTLDISTPDTWTPSTSSAAPHLLAGVKETSESSAFEAGTGIKHQESIKPTLRIEVRPATSWRRSTKAGEALSPIFESTLRPNMNLIPIDCLRAEASSDTSFGLSFTMKPPCKQPADKLTDILKTGWTKAVTQKLVRPVGGYGNAMTPATYFHMNTSEGQTPWDASRTFSTTSDFGDQSQDSLEKSGKFAILLRGISSVAHGSTGSPPQGETRQSVQSVEETLQTALAHPALPLASSSTSSVMDGRAGWAM